MAQNQVFISYAWGGESEQVANEVETIIRRNGIDLIRDKSDLGFKGLIREFMLEIGQGNGIVLIISDKYLKSKNCMFELMEVEKKGEFYNRIFPIILSDANIYDSLGILGYLKYWDQKIKDLNTSAKELENLADTRKVQEDINLYTDIRAAIDDLAGKLSNMNTLTLELMQSKEYRPLLDAILSSQSLNSPTASSKPSKKEGKVLYHIPGMMQVQRWTRCTVRLAWEEILLKEGLNISEAELSVESIRLGNIMQVGLGEGPDRGKFEIHSLSTEEQFIEEGEYTEWLFDVKALQLGRFSLVLKISLIQMIEGKERKKDIVLERVVITEIEAPIALPRFETAESGLQVGNLSSITTAQKPVPEEVNYQGTPMGTQIPLPTSIPTKTFTVRKLVPYAASVLVLLTAGVLIFGGGLSSSSPEFETMNESAEATTGFDNELGAPSMDLVVGSSAPGNLLVTFGQETANGTTEVMAFVISPEEYWQLQEYSFPLVPQVMVLPDSLAQEFSNASISPELILDSVFKVAIELEEFSVNEESSEKVLERIPPQPKAFELKSHEILRRLKNQ